MLTMCHHHMVRVQYYKIPLQDVDELTSFDLELLLISRATEAIFSIFTLTRSARRDFDSPNRFLALELEAEAIHSCLSHSSWNAQVKTN